MAKTRGAFRKGIKSGTKGGSTKPKSPGAKSKAQGGTAHKMSKPEGGKGKLKGAMAKGKSNMDKASKAVYGIRKGSNK